jgi:hypothetical protein
MIHGSCLASQGDGQLDPNVLKHGSDPSINLFPLTFKTLIYEFIYLSFFFNSIVSKLDHTTLFYRVYFVIIGRILTIFNTYNSAVSYTVLQLWRVQGTEKG